MDDSPELEEDKARERKLKAARIRQMRADTRRKGSQRKLPPQRQQLSEPSRVGPTKKPDITSWPSTPRASSLGDGGCHRWTTTDESVEPAVQNRQRPSSLPLALPEPRPSGQLVVPSSADLEAAVAKPLIGSERHKRDHISGADRERLVHSRGSGSGSGDVLAATPLSVVHVVDGDSKSRAQVCSILTALPCTIAQHESAEDFLSSYARETSACLVLVLALPGVCELDLLETLRVPSTMLPVLVVSPHSDVDTVVSAMQRGACGFLQKPPDSQRLLHYLVTMIDQSESMAKVRRRMLRLRTAARGLTRREQEMVEALGRGASTKSAATALRIKLRTAYIYRAGAMHKLGARSLIELVALAKELFDCS